MMPIAFFNTNNANEVLQHSPLYSALDYSENALSSLLFNRDINWFTDGFGAIAYSRYKNMNICLGGILAPKHHIFIAVRYKIEILDINT